MISFCEHHEFCSLESFYEHRELCSSESLHEHRELCLFESLYEFREFCFMLYLYFRVVSDTSNEIVTFSNNSKKKNRDKKFCFITDCDNEYYDDKHCFYAHSDKREKN